MFYGGIDDMRCGNCGKYPFCSETKGASQLECSNFQKKKLEEERRYINLDNKEKKHTKDKVMLEVLEIFKNRENYTPSSSELSWAIEKAEKFIKERI